MRSGQRPAPCPQEGTKGDIALCLGETKGAITLCLHVKALCPPFPGLLSISAAVISLGLACATAFGQRGRAVAVTVGLIGLFSVAGPLLVDLRTAGADTRNLAMGSPCSGANAMTLELAGYNSSELSFTIWALGYSLGYCICAAVLLGITIATFDRRLGRAATGGRRSALICALSAGAAPVSPL